MSFRFSIFFSPGFEKERCLYIVRCMCVVCSTRAFSISFLSRRNTHKSLTASDLK